MKRIYIWVLIILLGIGFICMSLIMREILFLLRDIKDTAIDILNKTEGILP